MRIISGKFKGRKFDPPIKKWPTRPTMDRAREALFNVLANTVDFDGITVLDLFGGAGMVSLEFISRGCRKAVLVEKYYPCIKYLSQIQHELDIQDQFEIVRADVLKYIQSSPDIKFDIVFADPPYEFPKYRELVDWILESGLMNQGGILIVEHDGRIDFKSHPHMTDTRRYGESCFTFFRFS